MSRPPPIAPAAWPPAAFRARRLVEFGHCDPAGIAFMPRLFEMVQSTIEALFPAFLGLDYRDIVQNRRLGMGYAHAEIDFLVPAHFGDTLDLCVLVERIGGSSLTLGVHAGRGTQAVFRATMVIVTTSLAEHKAVALPDWLRAAFAQYQELCR